MAKRKNRNGEEYPNRESAKYMNVLPACHTKAINQYFQPLNKKQAEFIRLIEDKEIVICKGVSGSGKTYCALATALSLLGDTYKQIILVKSLTTVPEESIGYLPGDTMEKMNPYIMSYSWNIDKLLNKKGAASELMKKGIVEVLPLAFVRGLTLDNAIVILDEVQNLSHHTFKTLMTRIGRNSKYIIMGDTEQIDRKRKNESALELVYDIFSDIEEVGHIEFTDQDCVRNPIIPKLIGALREHNI